MDRDMTAMRMFDCSIRERATFEAGIKMGTIYHQFVGTPFDAENVDSLEKAIIKAIEVQPYVTSCNVSIDRSVIPEKKDTYSYVSLTGEMIAATVCIRIDNVIVTAKMEYIDELGYPLMYISEINE